MGKEACNHLSYLPILSMVYSHEKEAVGSVDANILKVRPSRPLLRNLLYLYLDVNIREGAVGVALGPCLRCRAVPDPI